MLNISSNSVSKYIKQEGYTALERVQKKTSGNRLKRMLLISLGVMLVICFLPWTQNIQTRGNVMALRPDQRPQTIHSVIGGRIEAWYVQEGQRVQKGDTILRLSEIKDNFFDPKLVERNKEQLNFKESSLTNYDQKIVALENQIEALEKTRSLKLEQTNQKLKQAQLKVQTDSMDLVAAQTAYLIAEEQLNRMKKLYEEGLKSLVDYENRQNVLQKASATLTASENKLLTSQSELLNARVELMSVRTTYDYEIAKAQSEKNSATSNKFDAEAEITKLRNHISNLEIRNQFYFITAPQEGFITKAIKTGIGELIKEGEPIISIMPANYDLAIEMFVEPVDLPLVKKGQHVRIRFDGWPAIVFSGWPNSSYGTYGGTVYAIDNFISDNGKYRVIVVPDKNDPPWPDALRVGAGTSAMLMLNDVPIWYELWRKINGFPPDFYHHETKKPDSFNEKHP